MTPTATQKTLVTIAALLTTLALGSQTAPAATPAARSHSTPASLAKVLARAASGAQPRRRQDRRLATLYVSIPTVESHAACNYNGPYDAPFGNRHEVVVWIPVANPLPGLGPRQRLFYI